MTIKKIYQILLALIIFLVPSNLFFKFFEFSAFVNGLQVDYLIPKIYLSDIFIFLILIIWFLQSASRRTKTKTFILPARINALAFGGSLFLIFFSYQFLTQKPLASLWYFLKLAEMGLFALFLTKHKKLLTKNYLLLVLLASLLFQSLLAIYQFHNQSSFLSYLFLGESNLNNYIGLAKGVFNGVEKILPYGTTAHPNILAGFLVIYLILTSRLVAKFKKLKILYLITSIISLYALFLTQSVSAWLALTIGIIACNKFGMTKFLVVICIAIFLLSPLAINQLALKYPDTKSLTRRALLNQSAINMFRKNFILGVGLNNFTARVEEYSSKTETTRFVQPVHNIALLILSETGLLGIIILTLFFIKYNNSACAGRNIKYLVILLPIAALDHYLLTNQTGLLLLVLLLTRFKELETA